MFKTLKLHWYIPRLQKGELPARIAAAQELGNLGDIRAVEPLINVLEWNEDQLVETLRRGLTAEDVQKLIRAVCQQYSGLRCAAAQALGKLPDARGGEALMRALHPPPFSALSADFAVRRAAAEALGNLCSFRDLISPEDSGFYIVMPGSRIDRNHLLEALSQALGPFGGEVAVAAAEALAKLGDPRAVDPLLGLLGSSAPLSSTPLGRLAAAQALGRLGDPRATEGLILVLGDSDAQVRGAAAWALGQIADRRAVEYLELAMADSNAGVRQACVAALAKLGEPLWQGIVRGDDGDLPRLGDCGDARAAAPLLQVLADSANDPTAPSPLPATTRPSASAAARARARRQGRGGPPAAKSAAPPSRFQRAAEALGRLGDRRAVEPLLSVLGDRKRNEQARCVAADALATLGDPRAVEPLTQALVDGKAPVRRAAAGALAKLGDPRWQTWIKGDQNDFTRLASCNDGGACDLLLRAIADRNRERDVRCAVAQALGGQRERRAVEPLIAAMGDIDSKFRCTVAAALGDLGDARAVEPLIRAMGGEERNLCVAATGALAKLGDARAVEPLIRAMEGPAGSTAAEALGALGDRRAVEPLLRRLSWHAAVRALGKLGDPRAIRPLIEKLHADSGDTRRAAAESLARLASVCPGGFEKHMWSTIGQLARQPHTDKSWSGCFGESGHNDSGIGLPFPDPPPGLDF